MARDYSKLLGKIVEVFGTRKAFAQKLGISEPTLNARLSCRSEWKQDEIETSCSLLGIEMTDMHIYFFAPLVYIS